MAGQFSERFVLTVAKAEYRTVLRLGLTLCFSLSFARRWIAPEGSQPQKRVCVDLRPCLVLCSISFVTTTYTDPSALAGHVQCTPSYICWGCRKGSPPPGMKNSLIARSKNQDRSHFHETEPQPKNGYTNMAPFLDLVEVVCRILCKERLGTQKRDPI